MKYNQRVIQFQAWDSPVSLRLRRPCWTLRGHGRAQASSNKSKAVFLFFFSLSLSVSPFLWAIKRKGKRNFPLKSWWFLVKYIYKYKRVESTFSIKLLITRSQDGRSHLVGSQDLTVGSLFSVQRLVCREAFMTNSGCAMRAVSLGSQVPELNTALDVADETPPAPKG